MADFRSLVLQSSDSRTRDDRNIVAVEIVGAQKLADFQLDQLEDFSVVDKVNLVHEHDKLGNADLLGEQDVLTGLRHRAVGGRNDQDRAVHLGRAGDHVLDVVSVTRAIDVRIVTRFSLILDVRGRDGDATLALFGSLVDIVIAGEGRTAGFGENLGDRRGQRGLAMVDVTDGADVAVRLVPLKLSLSHFYPTF